MFLGGHIKGELENYSYILFFQFCRKLSVGWGSDKEIVGCRIVSRGGQFLIPVIGSSVGTWGREFGV